MQLFLFQLFLVHLFLIILKRVSPLLFGLVRLMYGLVAGTSAPYLLVFHSA